MRTSKYAAVFFVLVGLAVLLSPAHAWAQSFGIELHNNLSPIAGAMEGASAARPQTVVSALGGNPATLANFRGANFTFGGGWAEPTYNVVHRGGVLPFVGSYAAKSEAEGSALGNIGAAQDLTVAGLPATMGVGLLGAAGAGLSFRDVPNSNGTSVLMQVLGIGSGVGVSVTDRFSVGATLILGAATLDAPFTGISGAAYDYALRGVFGVGYDLGGGTHLGAYYQTTQNFNFDDAIRLQAGPDQFLAAADVNAGLPDNIVVGVANECLLDGRLLLAADVMFKNWDNADMFRALYRSQWAIMTGAQYSVNPRVRLRVGYAYAQNPIDTTPLQNVGGVFPGALAAVEYVQSTVAVVNEHRVTAGIGIRDVLVPGLDFDAFMGGMFEASQPFGDHTLASLESYWVGAGLTWRFGAGGCQPGGGCSGDGVCANCTP